MLHLAIGSDRSQSDVVILPSSCHLFRASADSIISILSYLSMENICRLDTAVTNTAARAIWLSILRDTSHRAIRTHKHSHESIRWLVERSIRPEYLETSDKKCFGDRVNGMTLLGLDTSSLRNIRLCYSRIQDKDILSLAHGCSNLTEIGLFDCCNITDESMISLARCCRQLISVDVEKCSNITDRGLTAYADTFCNVYDAVSLPEMDNGSLLRNINLSYCIRITDIGISALGQSCHLLSNINLSDCDQVTDVGISALGRSCHLLSNINLSGCKKISEIGRASCRERV